MKNSKEYLTSHPQPYLYRDITDANIRWLSENNNLETICLFERPGLDIFIKLNEEIFKRRPEIHLSLATLEGQGEYGDIDFLKYMDHVEHLTLNSSEVTNLESIVSLSRLKTFKFFSTNKNISLDPILGLDKLENLSLSGSQKEYSKISALTSIRVLASDSIQENHLSIIAQLENLKELSLMQSNVKDLSGLSKSKNIVKLDLFKLRSIDNLDFISDWKSLTDLRLLYLPNIKRLPDMGNCIKLNFISIYQLNGLESLKNLSTIKFLKNVSILGAKNLSPEDFEVFGEIKLDRLVIRSETAKKQKAIENVMGRLGIILAKLA